MAPRRVRSRPILRHEAPTVAAISTALKLFSEEFILAKGIHVSQDTLNRVNETLGAHEARRGGHTTFQAHQVSRIVAELDDDVCSQMQLPLYTTLLKLFLQTTDCNDVERGLYLLAASLYRDSNTSTSPLAQQDIRNMKVEIGKRSLQPLLEFFTSAEKPIELRRWAGILLRQLFESSIENIEMLELGSEKTRRNLGDMLSTETNDCLLIICGQIIKELVDTDPEYPRQSLWPANAKAELYEDFPDSSQAGRWNQHFQEYLDKSTSQKFDTTLYFVQNIYTSPLTNSERPGHTSNIIKDSEAMTIWSPASGSNFDQIIDIPLQDICEMAIITMDLSQLPIGGAEINFRLGKHDEMRCLLNGNLAVLEEVNMVMLANDAMDMREDLSKSCQGLEIREVYSTTQEASRCQGNDSQLSRTSTVIAPMVWRHGKEVTFESHIPTSQTVLEARAMQIGEAARRDRSEYIPEPADIKGSAGGHNPTGQRKFRISDGTDSQRTAEQSQGEAALMHRAKAPMVLDRKKGFPFGEGLFHDTKSLPKKNNLVEMKQKIGTLKETDQGQPTSQKFEDKVEKLSKAVPTHQREVLVGVLATVAGNLDLAKQEMLIGGQSGSGPNKATVSDSVEKGAMNLNYADGQLDSALSTNADGNDASTPRLIKSLMSKAAVARSDECTAIVGARSRQARPGPSIGKSKLRPASAAKYPLKSKLPLPFPKSKMACGKLQEKAQFTGTFGTVNKQKPAQKPTETQTAPNPDPYEINLIDEENVSKSLNAMRKSKTSVAKNRTKALARKPAATIKKPGKSAKGNLKQRQTASAALRTTAAATRPRRGAAKEASQKIHLACLSEDELDEAVSPVEVQDHKPMHGKRNTMTTTMQPAPNTKPHDENAVPAVVLENLRGSFGIRQADTIDAGLRDDSPRNDGYKREADTSQKRIAMKVVQRLSNTPQKITSPGLKKDCSPAEYFSLKLGDMLGDIGGRLSSDHGEHHFEISDANFLAESTRKSLSDNDSCQKEKTTTAMRVTTLHTSRRMGNVSVEPSDRKLIGAPGNRTTLKSPAVLVQEADYDDAADFVGAHDGKGISSGQGSAHTRIEGTVFNDKQTQRSLASAQTFATRQQVNGGVKPSKLHASRNEEKEVTPAASDKQQALDGIETSAKLGRAGVERNLGPNGISPVLDNLLSDEPLVDDHLTRKIQIVTFGATGAINQGSSSIVKFSAIKSHCGKPTNLVESPLVQQMKRTRLSLDESNSDIQIPDRPKKRQNNGPENIRKDVQVNNKNDGSCSSSSPIRLRKSLRGSKPSSQASRVDVNGSPRALVTTEKVDHFRKVTQKLLQGPQLTKHEEKGQNLHKRQIFGSKSLLTSIPKTRPSPPQNLTARYVKHQRVGNDGYEGIETKEVVIPEKCLADPFLRRQPRRDSGFTERLRTATAEETCEPETADQPERCDIDSTLAVNQTTSSPFHCLTTAPIQERKDYLPEKTHRVSIFDEQTTLVASGTELYSSLTDFTSESITEDEYSPLTENRTAWNRALRPHYAKLSAIVRRLHNEVFIRLADEEEVLGLLSTQYRENGSVILADMTEKLNKDKNRIAADLDKRKEKLLSVYNEAKTYANDCEKELKSSALPRFEKKWRSEQEGIHRMIEEGRKVC